MMSEHKPDLVGKLSFGRTQSAKKPTNRQKCLVVGSRAMSTKCRHLLNDLAGLMPHGRTHAKIESQSVAGEALTEVCHLHRCNSILFLESRKRETAFIWLGQVPGGPSAKLQLLNVHTADEVRMAGNCLKFSRPLLHFDHEFDTVPHFQILKALLIDTFNTPNYHPKSKPFIDHMLCFFVLDGKIWFRNYQILPDADPMDVIEIGPRFVMEPVVILDDVMHGSVLWKNQTVEAPGVARRAKVQRALDKMKENQFVASKAEKHRVRNPAPGPDPLGGVFKIPLDDVDDE